MQIRSNTLGKLQKIKDGTVFDNEFVFLREFIQNVQRSKATKCNITLTNHSIQFSDNGVGCKNPQNLFTLDLSQWDSTEEGFGIGFWSCLCLPQLSMITVTSKNWKAIVDVDKIFNTGDLSVEQTYLSEPKEGFEVVLYSDYFEDKEDIIFKLLTDETKYIDNISFYLNGTYIEKEDMFHVDAPFFREYNTRFFKAVLFPEKIYSTSEVLIYYEKRYVGTFHYGSLCYLGGVIEVKPGKIKLKEPDRTEIIRNDDFYTMTTRIKSCAKELYKDYIAMFGVDEKGMEDAIREWLEPKDYESYLDIDLLDTSSIHNKVNKDDEVNNMVNSVDEITSNVVVEEDLFKQENILETNSQACFKNNFSRRDTSESKSSNLTATIKKTNKTIKDNYQRFKKAFWVGSDEVTQYEKEIAKAKYCGISVIIAKNRLYEEVLRHRNICHISQIFEALVETFSFYDIELKTQKEINFIKLLEPIRIKFNLPANCFLICDLQKKNELIIDGKRLYKETLKNSKKSVSIYGCCSGRNIYLDRKALKLNNWQIKDKVGIHELKAILNSVNTIAHEMAHYLYGTTDNTIEHFKYENRLQEQIINLYV